MKKLKMESKLGTKPCLLLLDQDDIDVAIEERQAKMMLKEIFKQL